MPKKSGSGAGSLYFDNTKKKWIVQRDVIKPKSNKKDKVVRALEIEEQQQLTDFLINKTIKECPYKNAFLIQMYMGERFS